MKPDTPTTAPAPVLTPEEAEKLRWELQRTCDSDCEGRCQSCPATEANTLHASHEALRREVARLTEDRERIEWLERQGAGPFKFTLVISRQDGKPAWALFNTDVTGWGEGKTVREAIDAAMQQDGEK